MKKICHVTSAHPPEDGRIFRRACVSTAKAGYETYLVEQGESYDKQGVHIIGIGTPKKNGRLYRMTTFAKKAYRKALELDADLYHLHDPELLRYALKLKKRGKAVVFDSHENYLEQFKHKSYLPGPFGRIVSNIYFAYSKRIYKRIDGFTYPVEDGYLKMYQKICKRAVSTDNYPWLSELYDCYDSSAKREPNTACYVGALDEARGITQIVKGCYRAGCKLYLAGKIPEEYYNRLRQIPEYECVEYLGVIGRKEIYELLQKSSVGLCLLLDIGQYYKMQNLPTKVYEYMSMAMPVILNDSKFNQKAVEKMKFGICVDPMNEEEVGKEIRYLLDHEELQKSYGDNGRKFIKEKYCWDKEQNKLISMYRDILGE